MTTQPAGKPEPAGPAPPTARAGARRAVVAWWAGGASVVLACLLHGAALWTAMGGREGVTNEWPPFRGDHGFHLHQGIVSAHFLRTTGTNAGYDPSYMAGYAMSVVSLPSSNLSELVILAFGGSRPELAYKLYVLAGATLLPALLAAVAVAWGARPASAVIAAALFLAYFWTDFSGDYVMTGMMGYSLSLPLGLLAAAAVAAYLDRGGPWRWLGASAAGAAALLVHPTSPMLVGPAVAASYGVAIYRGRRGGRPLPASRHLGLWAMIPAIFAANAYWLVPGLRLASTAGATDFAFVHPESVRGRIGEIFWSASPIEAVLLALAPVGLVALARRDAPAAAGLGGFLASGFAWGYLAGAFRTLDALQPGRHTYGFYGAACIAAGIGLGEILARLRRLPDRGMPGLSPWAAAALIVVGVRMFAPSIELSLRIKVFAGETPLTSRPTPRFLALVDRLRRQVRPGERLLYEETGMGVPGEVDPFLGRHYSPMLPRLLGAEVIGGPYLHVTVKENFTQFGEGRLFGDPNWDRDRFVRYARLYRPQAIACWSPHARAFCTANPDLVKVVDDDGTLLIGRVLGFEGAAIRGKAEVTTGPNRIEVRDAVADADGLVVLRYHAVPLLRSDPPVAWETVYLAEDPVPFLAFRPNGGTVVFSMKPAPWSR